MRKVLLEGLSAILNEGQQRILIDDNLFGIIDDPVSWIQRCKKQEQTKSHCEEVHKGILDQSNQH